MEIIAQTNVYEQPQAYYRMPQGDRLQDDLDYGINGSVSTNYENKDGNYKRNAIVILVALIGGFIIYKNFNKK